MMLLDGRATFTASDLVSYHTCAHKAWLDAEVAAGARSAPPRTDEDDLIARKGSEHEAAEIAKLVERGIEVVRIERPIGEPGWRRAALETRDAMERGAEAIAGGVLVHGIWRGITDLLVRVARAGLWPHSYEVIETKLARRGGPEVVVTLAAYSEWLGHIQGVTPEWMHAVYGDGSAARLGVDEFAAYYRTVRERFLEERAVRAYPERIAACQTCRYEPECRARRRADDHPSTIAHIRRSHIRAFAAVGVRTAAEVARCQTRPKGIGAKTFATLRAQAALQAQGERAGRPIYDFIEPDRDADPSVKTPSGFEVLPEPAPGDVAFDMEGDPFYHVDGLEYLFGVAWSDEGAPTFRPFWGTSREDERRAFEAFVDFIVERRARFPRMHVYHYGAYEPSRLQHLVDLHGTREREVDELLKADVLVDLYAVVRGALRISSSSYSIKHVERFYRAAKRDTGVVDGLGSIVTFERWLAEPDDRILASIEAYNRNDCVSTLELHQWLLQRRAEAIERFGPIPWRLDPSHRPPTQDRVRDDERVADVRSKLARVDAPQARLLAHLVGYHRREARPAWRAFFARLRASDDELVEDAEAIAGLSLDVDVEPRMAGNKTIVRALFAPQDTKLRVGAKPRSRVDRQQVGEIVLLDVDRGIIDIARGPQVVKRPLPSAIVAEGPFSAAAQRDALLRVAESVAAGSGRYTAIEDLLARRPTRVRTPRASLQLAARSPDALADLALDLDGATLMIQGPPGTGKTFAGTRVVARLLAEGKRVAVASTSHKAIHHFLDGVEAIARERGLAFEGLKKGSGNAESVYASPHGFIRTCEDNAEVEGSSAMLVAGTAWCFAREAHDQAFDVLVIDEAGQVSLADAVAMGTCARNIILLGDPAQLPQVAQGSHPDRCGVSVLEHILGEAKTVPDDRGVFLETSFRLHPDICAFVSRAMYEGRLHADPSCARRRIDGDIAGAGLRFAPIEHAGNRRRSDEEASYVLDVAATLMRRTLTDEQGRVRRFEPHDVLVVAPYNAQVARMRELLDRSGLHGVRAGTVDKFQGQEAAVVLFTMATSSVDDLPRDPEFLFSPNRLNVAVSRAQVMAIVVASPDLVRSAATTIDQARMLNFLCSFVETAQPLVQDAAGQARSLA